MENKDLEWRMYGLVPYNISQIQKGIQFGHAVVEYSNFISSIDNEYEWTGIQELDEPMAITQEQYRKWAKKDKTFIILNGGTTNLGFMHEGKGTLNQYADTLRLKNIFFASFHEPDLGDQLTAIVFLVDERVWNYEKYPPRNINPSYIEGDKVAPAVQISPESEEAYAERLGGEGNVWLREFLSQFKLA